jgi:hypothetical protein
MKFVNSTLVILALLLWSLSGFAQITTGSMSGKVTDDSGEPLIGATVQAVHTPSGTTYGTATSDDGGYLLANLRIGGPYTVTVSYIGYASEMVDGITVTLGGRSNVSVVLRADGVALDEIVVSGKQDPVFSTGRTGASKALSNEQINSLPTVSRSINDFTRLTPQSNGNAFAGTNSRFNNYTIDGNIYNNNFGLGSGQFAGGNPISLDAIEAVSVNLAPYDVRYAGFTGAAVNAVTRSGSNEFEGSFYTLFRNDQMTGDRVGLAPNDLVSVERPFSRNEIYGGRIGGPIIKDKLFFFASVEMERESSPPPFIKFAAREGQTPDGQTISRVPLSEANFVRQSMLDIYGYDTGAPDSYGFESEATRVNLRFDYNINKNNKLSFRYNRFSSFSDIPTNGNSIRYISTRYNNTDRTGIESINFRNNNYTNDRLVQSYMMELNSLIGTNKSNQLNIGYTSIADPKRGIPGGQNFPMIEVLEPDAGGNLLYYMTMGNELFSVGNLLENKVLNITDNFTIYKGKHTYTLGANLEMMQFDNAFNPTFHGFYRYIGYDKFVDAVINRNPNVYPDAFAKGYALDGSQTPPTDNTVFGQLGVYFQDEIQLTDNFKLTAGLRVDLPFYPIDIPNNELLDDLNKEFTGIDGETFTPDVSVFPTINPLFSPRVGFNWDVYGDRTLQLRGGTGIFSGRIPFVWLSNQVNGSGVIRGGIGYEGQAVIDNGIIFNPDVTAYAPENPAAQLSNELNLTDRNFRLPQVWRTNFGVDKVLPGGIVATIDLMYNLDVSTPIAYNPVLRDPDGILSGPDQRPYWTSQPGLAQYSNDPNFRNVFLLTNANTRADYYSATIELSKTFEHGWYASLAYTRSRSRDLDAAGGSQAISLWPVTVQSDRNDPELSFAAFDQPNRVVGNLAYMKGNTTLNLLYIGGEAGRFSYTYSSNRAGMPFFGDGANRLMYVPNNASELTFQEFTAGGITYTPELQAQLLDAYIDQDAYLSSIRGQVAERNGALRPWVHRFDFSIRQDITFPGLEKGKLQLSFDFMNIGNMLNSAWGISKVEFQRNLLSLRSITEEGVPVYRVNFVPGTSEVPSETFRINPFNILQNTWQLQMGARITF